MKENNHNETIYKRLLDYHNITNKHDRKLLSNRLNNAYRYKNCQDNFRICFSDIDRTMTDEYKQSLKNGCCGFFDDYIFNEVTGNYFWIGFNYGH